MLSTLQQVISPLHPGAVGSFNVLDLDMALAVIKSAEALQSPVILGIATRHYHDINAPLLVPAMLKAISNSSLPIALHLDHAAEDEMHVIEEALDLGFSSIMIDGSALNFEQNVEVTARVVELAHRYGASVEGELGGIAGEEGVADTQTASPDDIPYTDAEEAQDFVQQTGIDALAIAVGTAHGIYAHEPHVDMETIRNIAARVTVPLVMHGATGISDPVIKEAVGCGIRKINYFSGLLQTAMDHVRANHDNPKNDYLGFKQQLSQQWQQLIGEQIRLYANLEKTDRTETSGHSE